MISPSLHHSSSTSIKLGYVKYYVLNYELAGEEDDIWIVMNKVQLEMVMLAGSNDC